MTVRTIDAVILAGGLGTRLRTVVSDVPKPLAPVSGRPFLDYQLAQLKRSGRVGRVILATGYMADKIEAHYRANLPPLPVEIVVEEELLGTGGGLVNALPKGGSERVLVLNGDSAFRWAIEPLEAALDGLEAAGASIALVEVSDAGRYGCVELEGDRIVAFREKRSGVGAGLINAGLYLVERTALASLKLGQPTSLERDVFPRLATEGRLAAVLFGSPFIDIGLPETYAAAASLVPDLIG